MKRIPTPKTIPFNGPIGLKEWLADHRVPMGHTFVHRGNTVVVNGNHYNYRDDDTLNETQQLHIAGKLNLYKPIQAYSQHWNHNNGQQSWSPTPNSEKRNDLPPIYMQWKKEYAKLSRIQKDIQTT